MHANLCQFDNFYNYSKKELQTKTTVCKNCYFSYVRPQALYVSKMAAVSFRTREARCLRLVSCYVSHGNATATHGVAMKRPLQNLELHNYPLHQTGNINDTKTSREPETLRSLQASSEFRKMF